MKNKMRLGDIATLITKGTTPTSVGYTFTDTGVNFVKIESIREDGTFIPDKFAHISDECNTKLKRSQLQENDILFSIAGAIGRTAIVTKDCLPANTNQALAIIRIPQGVIDYRFLLYALQSDAIIEQAEKQKQGVAQLNLSLQNINDFEIPFFTEEEQLTVVEVLSSVDSLLSTRIAQLEQLDELVKSRFIELFGDPIDNPLNWKVADFKEVVYFQEGPGVRNWQFRDSGIKLINIRNLVDDSLVLENTNNYLSEQEVEEKYKHFLLDVGDYVMASSGVTWGKIAEIYEEHLPLCLNTSIIRLRPYDETVISKKYLFHYIKGDAFRMQIRKLITGSAQPNFGPTHLKKISIIVPPIELQNQFAAFVEQTDKSKLAVQQSIAELEELKKSLMQKYFG